MALASASNLAAYCSSTRLLVAELDVAEAGRAWDARRRPRLRPHSLSAGPLAYSMKSAMSCGVSSMSKAGMYSKPAASQKSMKSTMPQPLEE